MKKIILLISAMLMTGTAAMAQFVIERTDGTSQEVEGNVTFSQDESTGDYAIGDTYQAENSIAGVASITRKAKTPEPSVPPKIGDYYYSDGTWSDGGLISIDADGLNPVWAEEKPAPIEGKTVIGIVFQTDQSRMARTDIDAGYTHGYVMAVKFAHGPDKMTTWYTTDYSFDCLGTAKLASTWYSNVNGRQETQTVLDEYQDDLSVCPAFDWMVNDFIAAPESSSGWFLPSTGQAWDMMANLCGGEVAEYMKEWQTYGYDATWYCSENVSYDVIATINSTMEKIPDADKELFTTDGERYTYGGILTSTPYDSESVNIFNIGTDGLIECMCNWYDGDEYCRPILAF